MTARCYFAAALLRRCGAWRNPSLKPLPLMIEGNFRWFSSSGGVKKDDFDADLSGSQPQLDLKSRIFKLRFPKRSATDALDRWVQEGGKVSVPELRWITTELKRAQRYKHALEIFSWMGESNRTFRLSPLDHAIMLELIAEVHGLSMAEAYFAKIEDLSKKVACLPLLHCYVKDKNTVSIQSEISGISSVEKVYNKMANDRHVKMGWSTYATLANIHTKHGSYSTALSALKAAEDTLSTKNRLGYFFLITLYANLQDKDGVLRVWQSSKKVMGRVTCANYMCIILCLLKVGDLEKAESVLAVYESELKCRKYDIRVSNVLLGAYVRRGFIERAERLHLHTMKMGGNPNYKTWEILMEGWVKSNQMDKVLDAMNKAFSMLKNCNWRPPSLITMAISEYFEKHVRIEDARKYVKVLRGLNTMNLLLYKSYLRLHIESQTPIPDVLSMMEIDNVGFDEEASSLIQQASTILPEEP